MAVISISNLSPVGSELFMDSESFMNEMSNEELTGTQGGLSPIVIYTVAVNSWWFVGGAALGGAGAVGASIAASR